MTTQLLLDTLAIFCLLGGLFFMFVGALGVVRLPDVYNRLHAASKCATLGLMGLALAACLHIGSGDVIAKSIALILFIFVSNPVGSHMLAKAAHRDKAKQWKGTLSDDLAEDNGNHAEGAKSTESAGDNSKKKSKHRAA